MPYISILTPVWNGLPYLKECVNSLLAQNFLDWELIISDDGSTDGSREYLQNLKDDRIQVYFQDVNLKIFGNLNLCISKASTNYCQILCQDDYFIDSLSLGKIVNYLKTSPIEIGFTRFNHQNVVQCNLTALQKEILPRVIQPQDSSLYFYIFSNIPGNLSNVCFNKKILLENGGFREDMPYAGDFECWSRIAQNVPFGIQDDMVVHVRKHIGAASVFLNKKGELLTQSNKVFNRLYLRLISNSNIPLFLLKLHATINFDSQQRYDAIKRWIYGNKEYYLELNQVSTKAEYIYPWFLRWVVFFFSLGGRLGRALVAKAILNFNKSNKNGI